MIIKTDVSHYKSKKDLKSVAPKNRRSLVRRFHPIVEKKANWDDTKRHIWFYQIIIAHGANNPLVFPKGKTLLYGVAQTRITE